MKRNIIIIISLLLMLLFVGYSYHLFSAVEKQKNENEKLSDSLRVQLDSNVKLQIMRDSLVNVLSNYTMNINSKTKQDSAVISIVQNLKTVSQSAARLNNQSAVEQASIWERKGFSALLNNQFDSALVAFTSAENASPSYHMAYEISRLLRKNKNNFDSVETQKMIKKEVVSNLSWGAPKDLLSQLKKQVAE